MPRFVVMLRGINVGTSNRVAMADLRAMLERLGFTGVKTLLNSGNAVFDAAGRSAARNADAIAAALQRDLQLKVPVIVKSGSDLAEVIRGCIEPPPEAEHSRFLVAFAQQAAALRGLDDLRLLVQAQEQFTIGDHAAYLICPSGIRDSKAAGALHGKLGRSVTTRNWATVLKLQAMLDAGAAS